MWRLTVWILVAAVLAAGVSSGCSKKPKRAGTMHELPGGAPFEDVVIEEFADEPIEPEEPMPPDEPPPSEPLVADDGVESGVPSVVD